MAPSLRQMPLTAALLVLAALPGAGVGQDSGALDVQRPEGWEVRTDQPGQDAADVDFMDMPPGWHITTGPAAIFWNPEQSASGTFRVEMESFLFDPRDRREAFGFFVGGRNLDQPDQRYLYFLVREGGQALVKRRVGEETEVVVDWSDAPSMASWADRGPGEETAHNVLALEAGEASVRFLVNGQEVASLPRASLDVEGIVGLRVNHGLNIHVSRLEVLPGG